MDQFLAEIIHMRNHGTYFLWIIKKVETNELIGAIAIMITENTVLFFTAFPKYWNPFIAFEAVYFLSQNFSEKIHQSYPEIKTIMFPNIPEQWPVKKMADCFKMTYNHGMKTRTNLFGDDSMELFNVKLDFPKNVVSLLDIDVDELIDLTKVMDEQPESKEFDSMHKLLVRKNWKPIMNLTNPEIVFDQSQRIMNGILTIDYPPNWIPKYYILSMVPQNRITVRISPQVDLTGDMRLEWIICQRSDMKVIRIQNGRKKDCLSISQPAKERMEINFKFPGNNRGKIEDCFALFRLKHNNLVISEAETYDFKIVTKPDKPMERKRRLDLWPLNFGANLRKNQRGSFTTDEVPDGTHFDDYHREERQRAFSE
eukprot:TRINITY_DN2286_c0_g1_i4.p1 TRINITY_DN2286_c0_g1~~TRINITY_DN2286_c0_g1_i4.p1  ORF type:complete len:426 (+),score=46.84 TRINITY_DN2286_c0_g1_i4:172-1278(+)